jgi:hypothetical protein
MVSLEEQTLEAFTNTLAAPTLISLTVVQLHSLVELGTITAILCQFRRHSSSIPLTLGRLMVDLFKRSF